MKFLIVATLLNFTVFNQEVETSDTITHWQI